nr:hypothetical protein [Vallitaleaceae bacterium]
MKTGLITKIDNDYLLIMRDDMTVERLKLRKHASIGTRIQYNQRDLYKGFKQLNYKKIVTTMALLVVMMLTTVVVFAQDRTTVVKAVVSIDINPSVELMLNEDSEVIDYREMNKDAYNVVNRTIVGMSIEDALTHIIINAQNGNYLIGKDTILISSVLEDNQLDTFDNTLESRINQFVEKNKYKYAFYYMPLESSYNNDDRKVSLGRNALLSINDEKSVESMSVESLIDSMNEDFRAKIKLVEADEDAVILVGMDNQAETPLSDTGLNLSEVPSRYEQIPVIEDDKTSDILIKEEDKIEKEDIKDEEKAVAEELKDEEKA